MIGLSNSPFYADKSEKGLNIQSHLTDDEEVVKVYKNMNMYAFFTNKRIIFTYAEKPAGKKTTEIVPYRSIIRLNYLDSEKFNTYNIEIYFPDCIVLQFSFPSQSEATSLIRLIEKHI